MCCGIYKLQHQETILHRSSHWQMSKVRVVKNLANFIGKNLCWSLILIKRDSSTIFFLWNLVCFCLQCVFNRISNQYLRKQYLRISLGFSYVFEMLSDGDVIQTFFSRLYKMLCSRKVNKSQTTCSVNNWSEKR